MEIQTHSFVCIHTCAAVDLKKSLQVDVHRLGITELGRKINKRNSAKKKKKCIYIHLNMNSSSVTKETRYRSLDDKICAHVKKVRFFNGGSFSHQCRSKLLRAFFSVTSINNLEAYH